MDRRQFINLVGCAAVVASPLIATAQDADKVYRIAYLTGGTESSRGPLLAAFIRGLHAHGYIEGQNLSIERRFAEGQFERLPALARELLEWKPDVLFVSTTPGNLAAKAATTSVPIVMVGVADPLGVGLVASLARPGGNITGVTNIGAELAGKRLEVLKEIVPTASKVAIFINLDDQNAELQMRSARLAAEKLAVQLYPILHIRSGADLKGAFEVAARANATAGLRMIDPLTLELRKQTAKLAMEHRLPVIYPFRGDVVAGGLASYGTSLPDQYQQAATFVHKIINGSKPADLPVQQPTKFELVINLKTAKTLGLTVPPTILARADETFD